MMGRMEPTQDSATVGYLSPFDVSIIEWMRSLGVDRVQRRELQAWELGRARMPRPPQWRAN